MTDLLAIKLILIKTTHKQDIFSFERQVDAVLSLLISFCTNRIKELAFQVLTRQWVPFVLSVFPASKN